MRQIAAVAISWVTFQGPKTIAGVPVTYLLRVAREFPLLWFLAGSLFACICLYFFSKLAPERRSTLLRRISVTAGFLVLGIFVALTVASLRSYMFDDDEANILSVAAATLHGQPAYHSVTDTNVDYVQRYGPVMYLLYRSLLVLGGGQFWVLRTAIVLANLLVCFLLYKLFRKFVRWQTAVALLALPLCQFVHFLHYALGLRSDIWVFLLICLALLSTTMDSELWAALLTGFFAGLAIDLKSTIIIAFSLLLLLLYKRGGAKFAAIAMAIAGLTAAAPFVMSAFPFHDYMAWLQRTQRAGISPDLIYPSLAFSLFLVLPIGVLACFGINAFPRKPGDRWVPDRLLLFCCVAAVGSVAMNVGTGVWHYWQLTPIVAVFVAMALQQSQKSMPVRSDYALFVIVCGSTAVALSFAHRGISTVAPPPADVVAQLRDGQQEIHDYLNLYRGRSIQMGYGDTQDEPIQTERYKVVLSGQPYTFDESSRLEFYYQTFPTGVITKMGHCSGDIWLMPHNQKPFQAPEFPSALHDAFVANFTIRHQMPLLDAWVCNN
jgi:hypothetical protein